MRWGLVCANEVHPGQFVAEIDVREETLAVIRVCREPGYISFTGDDGRTLTLEATTIVEAW